MINLKSGYLDVWVYASDETTPLKNAKVLIKNTDNTHLTDELGQTNKIVLETVSKENSFEEFNKDVSVKYDLLITCDGFSDLTIEKVEIFEGITSIQKAFLTPFEEHKEKTIVIEPIVISENYSSKYNDMEKNIYTKVLKEVVIPEFIIVHDGYPSDYFASNYYVEFSDYIKNVASSEIYPTWNEEALKANVLAIISFALNRVYTEWYSSQGYAFTITSLSAYDQKYTVSRTIYDSISLVVDEMIPLYIKRMDKDEPLFAQYCDGVSTTNSGWLYQWGSNELATKGYSYEEILKYYYGSNLEIVKAEFIEGLPTSFPGYVLSLGSCGEEVKKMQEYLNIIRGNYPGLIYITNPNGEFDENTKESILYFQKVFNLSVTGVVDYATWYKISYLYMAVMRMIYGVYDR